MSDDSSPKKYTPMLEQYLTIKKEAPEALLFFRMGDFYELFLEDAEIASKELQITLTARHAKEESKVPMCGVPWHAVDAYLAELLRKGYTVALCDQLEDPKATKGLVKRGITRILTPGTAIEEGVLEAKEYNFLGALLYDEKRMQGALAWVDISTGKWSGFSHDNYANLRAWVTKLAMKELLVPDTLNVSKEEFPNAHVVRVPTRGYFTTEFAEKALCKAQGVPSLESTGLEHDTELVQTCGALVTYIQLTQKCEIGHLQAFEKLDFSITMLIDEQTERNLEIFVRTDGKKGKGTLFYTIDKTATPMGARFLEERLQHPYKDIKKICSLQEGVTFFITHPTYRKRVQVALEKIFDIERLTNRIILQRAQPKDIITLKHSLHELTTLEYILAEEMAKEATLPEVLQNLLEQWDTIEELVILLERALSEPAPTLFTHSGVFTKEYNAELKEVVELSEHAEKILQEYIRTEQEQHGIQRMKLGYTKVFGYYIEISKASNYTVPEHFMRKQSLVNAERYTTKELISLEEKILSAVERRKAIEASLLQDLYKKIRITQPRIACMARFVAVLDYLQSCAELAVKQNWCKPTITNDIYLDIRNGRHPVVEDMQGRNTFIANSILLSREHSTVVITGPNMGGKSTLLRQVAISSILAQIGSYIPATSATIGIVDKVFCRVGASDNLAKGQSTFMVEMIETSRILRQATPHSLLILDEIGRGTATFDGLAIAWAILEEITKASLCARTIFATHYHELTALEKTISVLYTAHFAVKENNGDILFLRKLHPGPADKSYGIEVAKLAGIPENVVARARTILKELEEYKVNNPSPMQYMLNFTPAPIQKAKDATVQTISPVVQKSLDTIQHLDMNTTTPLKALEILTNLWSELQ